MPAMIDRVRRATAEDYAVFRELFRELAVDDPVPTAERFARELAPRILCYERGGEVIGYVSYYTLASVGYVSNLVVAPAARGARIGEALLDAAARELRTLGATERWHLNVKADNAAAIRLYERVGMQQAYGTTALRLSWASAERLPVDDVATAAPIAPDDDAEIERAFGLLAGRLQFNRSRAGRVLIQLRDAQRAPLGVACFDPAFPGAFPFAVVRPALAGSLLRAIRPHARPDDPAVDVVIERDAALADALIAAGAELRQRLLHYAGPLPGA